MSLSSCPTSSTLRWLWEDGSTLTCSRSLNSPLCTTLPFCGRTASAARPSPSCRVSSQPPRLSDGVPVNRILALFCVHAGAMYPTSMRINEEGRLVVNFKTEARFRGQFVMSHPGNTHTHLPHWSPMTMWSFYITNVSLHYTIYLLLSISGEPN